jgi:trimethylamine--corrinoid protein Co-methyltransferase
MTESSEVLRDRPRRRARGESRAAAPEARRQARRRFAPTEILSADEIEAVHEASLTVLSEIGIDVLHEGARIILKSVGADVATDGPRVRFDRELVERVIGLAPESFTFHARDPARSLLVGGEGVAFGTVASAPNVADRAGGRRPGNREDYRRLLMLAQGFDQIEFLAGYPVEPADIHASVRHLDALYDALTLTDRPLHAYSLGRERNLDAIEMVRIARGIDRETLEREPSLFTIINTSSPLRLDGPMAEGVIQMALANQITCVTPFTLAGAMAPVTVAGALAQQNAEALAGLVLAQSVRPGSPFIYGGFTSNVDMKSGAPAFGTPEYMKAAIVGGQLARRYRLPYRSSNTCAANTLDAQAAYESVFSLWGAVMGGANFVMHGAGWMEGGLQASFEKMVLDADLIGMVRSFLEPLAVDEDALALEAMREVGPGGHFFGTAHTQARYRTAFFAPLISDWRNYESWREAGSPTAYDRAEAIYRDRIAAYEPPQTDPAILEELAAFVARRKEEGGAPTDY